MPAPRLLSLPPPHGSHGCVLSNGARVTVGPSARGANPTRQLSCKDRLGNYSGAAVRRGRAAIWTMSSSFHASCTVVSDGLQCFARVTDGGCTHQAITGSGATAVRAPAFKWVNTALGNIKAAIVGTYRSINGKHFPRYLAEFEYRFNRRYDLAAMLPRLCWASVRTTPMPYRLLRLAEVYE